MLIFTPTDISSEPLAFWGLEDGPRPDPCAGRPCWIYREWLLSSWAAQSWSESPWSLTWRATVHWPPWVSSLPSLQLFPPVNHIPTLPKALPTLLSLFSGPKAWRGWHPGLLDPSSYFSPSASLCSSQDLPPHSLEQSRPSGSFALAVLSCRSHASTGTLTGSPPPPGFILISLSHWTPLWTLLPASHFHMPDCPLPHAASLRLLSLLIRNYSLHCFHAFIVHGSLLHCKVLQRHESAWFVHKKHLPHVQYSVNIWEMERIN